MGFGPCSKGEAVGVEACDAYVDKFESCLDKLPDEERARRAPEAQSQRKILHAEAQNADARATIAAQCTTALAAIKDCP